MANSRKTLEQTTEITEEDLIPSSTSSNNRTANNVNDDDDDDDDANLVHPIELKKTSEKKKTVSIAVGEDFQEPMNSTNTGEDCNYTGDIYGEKKHGKGVLSWSDGRIYAGGFFADRRHGFGTFQDPDASEFKGLFCQDERFGPGILFYKSLSRADVGFWLSESLIRLLYRHPDLNFDLIITDKRRPHSSSLIVPSWYSPQEILRTMTDIELVFQKKTSNLFCNDLQTEDSPLSRYLTENCDRVQDIMHDRYAQLDAYLISVAEHEDEFISKEKSLQQRNVDILPPNETFEQRQLYFYVNKFWPLKQRATFPIDEILSNRRSAFPRQGPIENASLAALEFAFDGDEQNLRDLLVHRLVYVDVCDARGLTALHMATYNIQLNIINLLLDFGANVNQLSDDCLTPLTIAFLLYYGNNPQRIVNIALEHVDPPLPPSRILLENDSLPKGKTIIEEEKIEETTKRNSYGYEIKEKLRQRIDDEQFHRTVFTMISLLLRRGADPSMSDWPLPCLALAVRSGDLKMVQLLLKKKAQVNCQLDAVRHAKLTPLHIACGCLEANVVEIARVLLENGAHVNAEALVGKKEYFTFIDPQVKSNVKDEHGRTPLHIACTRDESPETLALVRLLLEYDADPNAVCYGQTPLTLAIALANEPVVDLLLNHHRTDPSTVLGSGNGNALCLVLSTMFEARWPYQKRLKLIERLIAKNPKVLYPIRYGPKNILGSCVDYAYYTYFADIRISQTPYHALTTQERLVYNERKELLAFIAKSFREEVSKYENFLRIPTPITDDSIQRTSPSVLFRPTNISRAPSLLTEKTTLQSWRSSGEFRFCATCGRSTGVRLTLCKRCQKTAFCSKMCKINGWNEFHRYECHSTSSNHLLTRSKTFASKPKLSSRSSDSSSFRKFEDFSPRESFSEEFTTIDRDLYKETLLSLKQPSKSDPSHRLPPVSVAKLLREKRLKKLHGPNSTTQCVNLEGIPLSWNHTYNAPENYSFN